MHVSGHTSTIHSSVTANMHLIGERYFLYRYRVQCDRALILMDFFINWLTIEWVKSCWHDASFTQLIPHTYAFKTKLSYMVLSNLKIFCNDSSFIYLYAGVHMDQNNASIQK